MIIIITYKFKRMNKNW